MLLSVSILQVAKLLDMSDTIAVRRQPPLGIRLLHALRKEPDWLTMPAEDLIAYRDAENRRRASGRGVGAAAAALAGGKQRDAATGSSSNG
jgi:hypothetical protein